MSEAAERPRPTVTISIATYDRPALLERALRSCIDQANALRLAYEILVTDNHPSGNAAPVVERLAAGAAVPIRYQRDLTRNMSTLRNAGIKAARGDWVAFIDDDEFAEPDWLDALMGTLRRTGADIAVGPRRAVFADGCAPAYDPTGAYFERVYPLAPDVLIPLTDPDGRPRYGLGTGNSIISVQRCLAEAEPFRPAFGDAGGEDIEFFMRQHIEGRTLAWAAGAVVTEVVPAVRTRVSYRLIRAKRETQIFASIYMAHARHPRRVRAVLAAGGLVQLVAGTLLAAATLEFGSERRLRGRLMATVGLGKLTWRRPVGYIDEANARPAARASAGPPSRNGTTVAPASLTQP